MARIKKIKNLILQSKVFENYFFMTLLQGFSSLIGLFIYPYLIKKLGSDSYGLYVFAYSNVFFLIALIRFGFTFPALKKISLYPNNKKIKGHVLSSVFTAKFYLSIFSGLVLCALMLFIPFLRNHYKLYFILFSLSISETLLPIWYFQGIQKMKLITYIQLGTKLLMIPFILIFVNTPNDLLTYTIIITGFAVLGAFISVLYIRIKEGISLYFISYRSLKRTFKEALPFFGTEIIWTLKKESITLIIGAFFGMKDVALYDLANKIIMIPRILTMNINDAIFPKIIKDIKAEGIKKIIRYETYISLSIILGMILFGYWAVLLLGGKEMTAAYPLVIALSITIYTVLIVGCYIYYIFIPQNKNYFITKNQLVSLISFILLGTISLFLYKSVLFVVLAYSLSGVVEIIYCRYLIKKHQLL